MRVVAVDTVNKKATVLRGWLDSIAVYHYANDEVQVDPRFPLSDILDTMIDELASWPPDLYQVTDQTFTITSSFYTDNVTFELPASWIGMLGVLDVRRNTPGDAYSGVADTRWPEVRYRLQRGTPAGFLGAPNSGLLLRLLDSVWQGSLYVRVALPFDTSTFELDTDLVDDVGIASSMLDVLTMGVKLRLMGDQENARSARSAQDDVRIAQEVPPGSATNSRNAMWAMYLRRRSEEMNRLRRFDPPRFN